MMNAECRMKDLCLLVQRAAFIIQRFFLTLLPLNVTFNRGLFSERTVILAGHMPRAVRRT
jgi:hypothetical protein